MSNYYHSKYGLYNCWSCLCEVCTRVHCPKNLCYKDKLSHCLKMLQRESCPTVKCDSFEHKEKHIIFRVKQRTRKVDLTLSKLDAILEGIEFLKKGH